MSKLIIKSTAAFIFWFNQMVWLITLPFPVLLVYILFTQEPREPWYNQIWISFIILLAAAFIIIKNSRLYYLLFGKYTITVKNDLLRVQPKNMVFEKEWTLKKEKLDSIIYLSRKNKIWFNKGAGHIRCRQKEAERIVQFLKANTFISADTEMFVHSQF